ncbi:serine/threonine-protein phosphatase 7 long form homolog [Mercurialis annua]|uniref:serine/threonine-protein phosphatase 7 long form homolog n=1 Tax=Mercurialis annua TaxID=3986 RepID=UPI002160A277|nr:serine/threonine-protein phosphatase 7 long form homolog [Mercurialis annua]
MTVIVFVMTVIVLMNVTLVMYYSYESPFTMAERRDYYTPGPLVPDVLTMQDDHRSSVIWDNQGEESSLGSRSSARLTPFHELDSRIRNGIIQTGMSGFIAMRQFPVDLCLITALVERWRLETHTFWFPEGECTITLQDVAILTGLPVDGTPVTGPRIRDWNTVSVPLLGREIEVSRPRKPGCSWVSGAWLSAQFAGWTVLHAGATEDQVDQAIRGYLWAALQGLCFPDLNSGHLGVRILPHLADLGHLRDISWGSAVLAYLYHELCLCASASANRQNIGGAVWILQLWAYERLRPLRPRLADFDVTGELPLGDRWGGPRQRERGTRRVPRHSVSHFRLLLDGLRYDDIVWQPYSDDVLQSIPQMYLTGRHIWRARVPMIYYHIVEWHQPDRVLQQFGLQQPIPLPAMQDRRLHNIQYQGNYNFDELLSDYIQIWNNRAAYVVQGYQLQRPPHYHSAYMEWFRSRSRRWITHEGAAAGQSRDTFEMIALQREARASRIGTAARSSQLAYGEERRDVTLPPPEPAVPAYVLPPLPPLTIDLAHIRGARRRQPRAAPPRERPADPIPPPVYFHFDPTATTDRRGEYYGPTQYYGSTSTSASQPPWHQTSFPQGPQVSSYQVPPSSMPFFEPSYGQTAYTTPLGTQPSQFHQGTPPASQFQQATPPASQFRQATPPASPFQQTTPPPFAASDQYYRPAPYTDAQPFTSFDQCYRPTMPSDDQPSTSHSRPSSSHQAQDPSQLHFTLSESCLFGPEIGLEAYEELLSRPDLTPPSFRLLPPTQEETGTAPPAADVQHSAQDEDAHDSGESPPVPRQFHSITDSSRHRRETHGLRIQRPRTRRYED